MRNGPYILVQASDTYPGKKYRGKYAYEHHTVYWKHHGIVPQSGEVIHHRNHDTRDNRIENLELKLMSTHSQEHAVRKESVRYQCMECGTERQLRPNHYRIRMKKGRIFCSQKCGAIAQHKRRCGQADKAEAPDCYSGGPRSIRGTTALKD